MKIAIDFDGVILNSENSVKYYADYYSYFFCGGKVRKTDEYIAQEKCFDWTREEEDRFFNEYYDKASNDCDLIVGAKQMLSMLKKEGHQLYIVSLRGYYRDVEIEVGQRIVEKLGVDFDGVFWRVKEKLAMCEELGVDLIIENDSDHVKKFKNTSIKVLYLKDGYTEKVCGSNITTVETWVDVYREIKNLECKKA